MTAIIPYLNKKFQDTLTAVSFSFGNDIDLTTLTEYILIEYDGAESDSGVTAQEQTLKAHITAYSRGTNAYSIYTLTKRITDLLKQKLSLSNGDVVRITALNTVFLDLEIGKKSVTTARINYWR